MKFTKGQKHIKTTKFEDLQKLKISENRAISIKRYEDEKSPR